jgi:hypothetical protein
LLAPVEPVGIGMQDGSERRRGGGKREERHGEGGEEGIGK